MNLIIVKTDIENDSKVEAVRKLLEQNPEILDWSVDMEDIDKVLRIEAQGKLKEEELIQLLNASGLACESLPE